jgi:hypothetical protein
VEKGLPLFASGFFSLFTLRLVERYEINFNLTTIVEPCTFVAALLHSFRCLHLQRRRNESKRSQGEYRPDLANAQIRSPHAVRANCLQYLAEGWPQAQKSIATFKITEEASSFGGGQAGQFLQLGGDDLVLKILLCCFIDCEPFVI